MSESSKQKKTREIDVWINEQKGFYVECIPYNDLEKPFIKAKLIVPVEPEIVSFESEVMAGAYLENLRDATKLIGRRWKCRFEEIL
jgi:hypothetical protein